MAAISLFLFGSPRIEKNNGRLPVNRRKMIALLAYLAVTGRPHSREALATLLWPEQDGASARSNLRRELSNLRQALGDKALLVDRVEVSLNSKFGLWCDAAEFGQLLATGEWRTAVDNPQFPLTNLQKAVDLYTSDFMAGFNLPDSPEFDEWQFFQREHYRQGAADILRQLVAWYEAESAFEEGVSYGRLYVTLDPLHEPAHRALMRLYALTAQQTAALRQYGECVRLLADELGLEPEAATTALYEAIRSRQFVGKIEKSATKDSRQMGESVRSAAPLHNLPVPTTSFIGREREVAEVMELLADPEKRLVTIVAPGGMGKTRLALTAATAVIDVFMHGVHFIPLAPLSSTEHILNTVADALHFRFSGGDPQQQLFTYLREKQMLLVMDNYEHLIAGAGVVSDILQTAPQIKVLATSRERLNLLGETVFPLGGLLMEGETADSALLSSAAQLLQQHAQLSRPQRPLQDEDVIHINRICQLVEGMPLALILAASWLEILSFAEIAEEIAQNLDFLTTDMRDVPERQRSMRVVFGASWERLTAVEQATMRQLSIFRGGFTRQAAQAVTGANLRILRGLVHKMLVTIDENGRYQIHELLRHYAADKLADTDEAEHSQTAHSQHYLHNLHQLENDLRGGRQLAALNEIETELENIRVAWRWALECGDETAVDRSLESLHLFCDMRGRHLQGIEFFELARKKLPATSPTWGRIVSRLSFMRLFVQGDDGTIEAALQQCLQSARQTNNEAETAFCLYAFGFYRVAVQDDGERGLHNLKEGLAIFRKIRDPFYTVRALVCLGAYHSPTSSQAQLPNPNLEALDIAQKNGNIADSAFILANLAEVKLIAGDYGTAESYCREASFLAALMDLRLLYTYSIVMLALILFLRGDFAEAERLIEEVISEAQALNFGTTLTYASAILSLCAMMKGEGHKAKEFGDKSLINPVNDELGFILAHWALACCQTSAHEIAWQHVHEVVKRAQAYKATAVLTWILPLTADLCTQQNQLERAVHHLALAHHHPLSPTGRLQKWPVLQKIKAQLQRELGSDRFDSAWEAGQGLCLETVISESLN